VDTTIRNVKGSLVTRFVDSGYYAKPEDKGGLSDSSIWKTDDAYRGALSQALYNMDNETSVLEYYFDHDRLVEMRDYVLSLGTDIWSDMSGFYERFMGEGY
jgi:hypothetical protein